MRGREYSRDEDRIIIREWHKGTNIKDIGHMLKRDARSTGRHALERLGLPKRDGIEAPRPKKSELVKGCEDSIPDDERDGRPTCPDMAAIMAGMTFSDRKNIQPQATVISVGPRYADDHTVGGVVS